MTVLGLHQWGFDDAVLTLSEDHAYESHGGGGGGGGGDAVPSPSSSTSSSSSRQHTKLFFDVQMAQSPSKVLSPTTAEMKYGKAFPPYQPKDQATGKWIPPQKPRSAYELFVDSTRGQARLHLKRRDRNNQVCMCVLGFFRAACEDCVTMIYWLHSHHFILHACTHNQQMK